jgi:predicted RNase H-like HicB family nuclease
VASKRGVISIALPVKIKKKAKVFISSCDVLDVHSQGYTEEEAEKNITEALQLFLESCFRMGTLEKVLKDCGVKFGDFPERKPKNENLITLSFPFSAKGSCLTECRV